MIDLSRPFTITRAIVINGICFDGVVSVGDAIGNIPREWVDQIPEDVVLQEPAPECLVMDLSNAELAQEALVAASQVLEKLEDEDTEFYPPE